MTVFFTVQIHSEDVQAKHGLAIGMNCLDEIKVNSQTSRTNRRNSDLVVCLFYCLYFFYRKHGRPRPMPVTLYAGQTWTRKDLPLDKTISRVNDHWKTLRVTGAYSRNPNRRRVRTLSRKRTPSRTHSHIHNPGPTHRCSSPPPPTKCPACSTLHNSWN